jgi:hypothetical protein
VAKKRKATKNGAPQKLLARGKGAIKRTPLHLADPAAVGEQEYELEDIVDHGKSHGVERWCCKWVGWEHTANTWEPLANLAGCEQFIARYNKENETKLKALEVELEAKNKKKREDKEQAEEAAAKKLQAEVESNKAMMASKGKLVAGTRRYATVWKWFTEMVGVEKHSTCTLPDVDVPGKICGEAISYEGGTSGMRGHIKWVHPEKWPELQWKGPGPFVHGPVEGGDQGDGAIINADFSTTSNQQTLNLQANEWLEVKKLRVDRRFAFSILKKSRPHTLYELDEDLQDALLDATDGAFCGIDHHNVRSCMLDMSELGMARVKKVNEWLFKQGRAPVLAGDVWSEGEVALLGLTQYHIDEEWVMVEYAVDAAPIGKVSHTGTMLCETTRISLLQAGYPQENPLDWPFLAISDNGANMACGWDCFAQAFCTAHTGELSANRYLEHPRIAEVVKKLKGQTKHFSQSPMSTGLLKAEQKAASLPEKKPPSTGNAIRWHFTLDQMVFFRTNQTALQMFQVRHGDSRDTSVTEYYSPHKLEREDWVIIEQSIAALTKQADCTHLLEGSKYVTSSIMMPLIGRCITDCAPDKPLVYPWMSTDIADSIRKVPPRLIHKSIAEAREWMHDDLMSRFVTNMDPETLKVFAICTLFDPRYKTWRFKGAFNNLHADTLTWVRAEWAAKWCPASKADDDEQFSISSEEEQEHKVRGAKPTMMDVMNDSDSDYPDSPTVAAPMGEDDLEKYIKMPFVNKKELDVLAWWKGHETLGTFREPFFIMVKQFLAVPATSAGVERMFSACGRMHGDLQKVVNERTMQHAMIARANYCPPPLVGRALAGKLKRQRKSD